MIGLLIKDFYVLKKQMKIIVLFLLFYGFMSYNDGNASMFVFMVVMFGIFLPITTISYDDRCEWNKLALTMPISITSIVLSKYLFGFIGIVLGTSGYLLLSALLHSFNTDALQIALAAICVGSVIISIYLPIIFKYGVEKSRYIMVAIFMLPTLVVGIFIKNDYKIIPSKEQIKILIQLAPLLTLGFVISSIFFSVKTMKQKEY